MIERTPHVARMPPRLLRNVAPQRTPVIDGRIAKPLSELVQAPEEGDREEDLQASLRLNDLDPSNEPIWDKASGQMLVDSLAYFAGEVISGPPEAPYNGKFLVGHHHLAWDELINSHDRVCIRASRDHGKSHFLTLSYCIWRGGYTHPGKLGYLFSATQQLAEDLLGLIIDEIKTNPKLQHLIPPSGDLGTRSDLTLRNGTVIKARGMGVRVRGGHPYWIVVDDCLSDEDIYSETIRRRHIDYFTSAITNMVVPGGQIALTGTPFHASDLYAYVRSTGEYVCADFPAIDKEGKLLFPERYSRKRLERRKREIGAARFAREFLVTPMTDEASLFPSTLFEGPEVRMPYTLGLPAAYWEERGMARFTGIDFAMSSATGADYTVILTIAVDDMMNRWLVNIRRGRGWGFQRQLDEIKDEYVLMRPDVIFAEANQMQRIFSDELLRTTDLPIKKFFTAGVQPKQPWRKGMSSLTMGKHSLERGLPALRIGFENRKWRVPRGDAHSIEMTDIWMGEFQALSWQDGKVVSVGEHDDCPMATWMSDCAARTGGFRFSFGDDERPGASVAPPASPPAGVEIPEDKRIAPDESTLYGGDSDDQPGWKPQEGAPKPHDFVGSDWFGF